MTSCGGQQERLKDILPGNENTNQLRTASQRINESIVKVTKTMTGPKDDKKMPHKNNNNVIPIVPNQANLANSFGSQLSGGL